MRTRGQTQYDYLMGITLLLLTVSGVFLQLPSIYDQAPEARNENDGAVAERVAENLTRMAAYENTENTLNYARLNDSLGSNWEQTRDRAGLAIRQDVNVTVTNGSTANVVLTNGSRYTDGENRARAVRIVQFDNESRCSPVCRMIVRVW